MKLSKKQLSLQDGIRKEWLLSNGIGGFAASTVLGANTRRYHGLLIAPLIPPANRNLVISKVDESITIGNEKFNLFNYQNLLNIINKKEEKLNNNEPDNLKKESEI